MKKFKFLAVAALLCGAGMQAEAQAYAENNNDKPALMLFGASFAIPQNGWFEIACEDMGMEAINKAVSGEAIYHDARRMNAGTDYTVAELDRTDVLVLMHVHNQNVANETNLKENWEDYTNIATTTDYAVAYDYVIKRYMADCAALEFNPESRYYGVTGGKPAKIVLCTHWHDGRTTYNPAIRKLAAKWGFPLVEFDTNIGFSKDDEGNADPGEPSRNMAHDKETIGGVNYGWHPKRGDNSPIQRRMASILIQTLKDVCNYDVPFEVSVNPVCEAYMEGEDARFTFRFRNGMFPYSLTGDYAAEGLDGTCHIVTREAISEHTTLSVNASDSPWHNADEIETYAENAASGTAYLADYCALPDYDSYVTRLNQSQNNDNADVIQLKVASNASRKAYISFQASELMPREAEKIVLRLFYKDYILGYFNSESSRPMEGIEYIGIEGNTNVYKGSNINWSTSNNHVFEPINAVTGITTDMAGGWISIDVTDWVNDTLEALEKKHGNQNTGHLTFRLFVKDNNWNALMNFYSSEGAAKASAPGMFKAAPQPAGPQLLFVKDTTTGVDAIEKSDVTVSGCDIMNPANETIMICRLDGTICYRGADSVISLNDMTKGIYLIKAESKSFKFLR